MILTLTYGDPDPDVRDAIAYDLQRILADRQATLYVDNFTGMGVYLDQDPEYSGVIVADVTINSLRTIPLLRDDVRTIARRHNQDCIGFIVCHDTDTLVYSH